MLKLVAIGLTMISRIILTSLNAKHLILRDDVGWIGNVVLAVGQLNILDTDEVVQKIIFLIRILSSFDMGIAESLHKCEVFNVYFLGKHFMNITISTPDCNLKFKKLFFIFFFIGSNFWNYTVTGMVGAVQLIMLLHGQCTLDFLLTEHARLIQL